MEGLAKQQPGPTHPDALLKKVLTKRELAHIKFNYFKKGVLEIKVDSSGWLYSLTLKKDTLLESLRSLSADIKNIRFRMGSIK